MPNRFVIADPDRCLGCYTCMAGCALIHKNYGLQPFPRLFVTHTGEGTMPIQCRHCEDAPCAKVCPVKAIEIKDQMVQINEGLCIGCKMCALACPFGCIEIQGTRAPSVEEVGLVNSQLIPLLAGEIGQKTIATKCDLCSFTEGGPTCVQVCPTKALKEVKGEEIERLSKLKRGANTIRAVSILRSGR